MEGKRREDRVSKRTIQKERRVTVRLVDNGEVYNHRLVEFFAKRISERGI